MPLIPRTKDVQVGALTDGLNWTMFLSKRVESGYLLYETGDLIAKDRRSVNQILGISLDFESCTNCTKELLVYFLKGNVPEFDTDENVYLEKKSLSQDMY